MKTSEISVVIPIFSRNHELGESIDSCLSQSFQDFEIVLVDNNAKEPVREVANMYARKYPEKIRILHEPVQGVCLARNTGFLESLVKLGQSSIPAGQGVS